MDVITYTELWMLLLTLSYGCTELWMLLLTLSYGCYYLQRVSNFEYLGARIEANGKSTPEIRRRLAMATTRLTKMISIWKGQCKKNKTESPRDSGIPNCLVWV